MQIVFLAAGKGTRVYGKIKKNKCLIKLQGKTILSRLIQNAKNNNISKINIVVGFKKDNIIKETQNLDINYIVNKKYKTTEMLHSLILAIKEINEDLIISYTDIVYESTILGKLKNNNNKNFILPILSNWKKIWKIRDKAISDDVESLKIKNNILIEIGKKVIDKKDVQGQYMGLIFIPKILRNKIINYYKSGNFKKMQLTQFINNFLKVAKFKTFTTNKSWYEFDDFEDIKNFKNNFLINDKNKFFKKK